MDVPDGGPRIGRRRALAAGLGVGAGLLLPAAGRPAAPGPGGPEDPEPLLEAARAPFVFRAFEWGARPPSRPPRIRDRRPIRILVHHTAGPNVADFSVAAAHRMARGIQAYHMDRLGWLDSGQHFTVSRGGHVMEGRLWSLRELNDGRRVVEGAHSPGQNVIAIGIENEGTYIGAEPPAPLWASLRATCAYACARYGILPTELYGHRDFRNTICPGDRLQGMLPLLRREVAGILGVRLSRAEALKAGWPLLREGDTGPLVEAAQYLLRDAGALPTAPDARFDGRTTAAVRRFQLAHRADDANGVLGGESWPVLARPVRVGAGGDAARAVELLARYRRVESVPDVVDQPVWQRLLGTGGAAVPQADDPADVANR